MHTAVWNHEVDLKNKRVAVIGSGASAVQVIPNIANIVDTLHCYHRKPPYIFPRFQFTFPNFVKAIFKYIPFIMWMYRCTIYILQELMYVGFRPDFMFHKLGMSDEHSILEGQLQRNSVKFTGRKITTTYRKHELRVSPNLWNDMEPKYAFGCKRVLISENYYATMAQPNVHVHSSHITKIEDRTIYTKDGSKEEIDVG